MHAYQAYRQQQSAAPPTRIELILKLYDGVIAELERARGLLAARPEEARRILNRCQVVIAGVAGGIDPAAGELAGNFVRLYEYVVHSLAAGDAQAVSAALEVLGTLREGFEAIRGPALELERGGQLPPLENTHLVQAVG